MNIIPRFTPAYPHARPAAPKAPQFSGNSTDDDEIDPDILERVHDVFELERLAEQDTSGAEGVPPSEE
jgi:hypothetical protein